MFPKIPLKLATPTHAYYTVYFKLRVLSVFPSCSNVSTHFHIETPSNIFYYMEESVLLGTKPLVDSIRHFIRDPSGVFSVFHQKAQTELTLRI